jgi:hypothetical protein
MKLLEIVNLAYKNFFQHLMHGKNENENFIKNNKTSSLLHSDHDDELIESV